MNQEITPDVMKYAFLSESVWKKLDEVGVILQKQEFQLVILSMDRIIKSQMEIHYNIEVTLFHQGNPVWMGTDLNDYLQKSEWWYSKFKPIIHDDDQADHRRYILKAAMLEVGFTEHPKEYWRFMSKNENNAHTISLAETRQKIDISGPFSIVTSQPISL